MCGSTSANGINKGSARLSSSIPHMCVLQSMFFRVEFLDMKQRYRLLYGEDFLQKLELKRERLRFQCEQELKGKDARLRQLYLEASQTGEPACSLLTKVDQFVHRSFSSVLHLQRMPASGSAEKIFAGLSQLRLSTEAIARVYDLRRQDEALSQTEIDTLFRRYLTEIQAIVEFVDKMNFEQS